MYFGNLFNQIETRLFIYTIKKFREKILIIICHKTIVYVSKLRSQIESLHCNVLVTTKGLHKG